MRWVARVLLRDLTKRFGKVVAVDRINLEVNDGEFLVLLGPSGCGKSTTLRLIAGLERPDRGEIWIGDKMVNEIDPTKRNVAMVFQSYALYPHMTVFGNIEFPLRMRGVPKSERVRKVKEVASFLGIEELLERKPSQLSGGQQQRVALARAIVREPEVFLLDEPLSNLDAKLRVKMRFELKHLLSHKLGITTIYVTHDQVEAMTMADKIAVMNEGKIQQVDTPDNIFYKPSNVFVAGFVGSPPMNFLKGEVKEEERLIICCGDAKIPIPPSYKKVLNSGKKVVVGFRPQHVEVSDKPIKDFLESDVVGVERLGTENYIHVRLSDVEVILQAPPEVKTLRGKVYWRLRENFVYIFDAQSGKAIYP